MANMARTFSGSAPGQQAARFLNEHADRHAIRDLVPEASIEELDNLILQVPEASRHVVHRAAMLEVGHMEQYFAAACAAKAVEYALQPNSATNLLPLGYTPGATIPTNTVVQLVPYLGNVAQPTFNFVRYQRFFGFMTSSVDSSAGWHLVSGSVKLSTDAISGINEGDAPFTLFQPDVVMGRMITGEYERHAFIESVPFTASAVLKGPSSAPCINGLILQYWDFRCQKDFDPANLFGSDAAIGLDFREIVREVMSRARAGVHHTRLFHELIR